MSPLIAAGLSGTIKMEDWVRVKAYTMEVKIAAETVGVLRFLLPGFFAAWLFYLLTPHRKNTQFERIIEAFILTGGIQFIVLVARRVALWIPTVWPRWNWGVWTENRALALAMFIALITGLVLILCANNDFPQRHLRSWKVTKETSYPSEWAGVFRQEDQRYVILNLSDDRRLMGKLDEWPNYPDSGHFVLLDVAWLDGAQEFPQPEIHRMIVPAKDVGIVEILKNAEDQEPLPVSSPAVAPVAAISGVVVAAVPPVPAVPSADGVPVPSADGTPTTAVIPAAATIPRPQHHADRSTSPTTETKDGSDGEEEV